MGAMLFQILATALVVGFVGVLALGHVLVLGAMFDHNHRSA
jgi:hypothetical protein